MKKVSHLISLTAPGRRQPDDPILSERSGKNLFLYQLTIIIETQGPTLCDARSDAELHIFPVDQMAKCDRVRNFIFKTHTRIDSANQFYFVA